MACLSLWLRAAYPPLGIWGTYDDQLFIRYAASLGQGNWLGHYNQFTHIKGMFYSLFILLNHVTGLPLKISEHVAYLLVSWLSASIVARLFVRRWLSVLLFLILAFSPMAWSVENARIMRESVYVSLGLILFFLFIHYLRRQDGKTRLGITIGLLGACFWLTREEGIWLLPALALILFSTLTQEYEKWRDQGGIRFRTGARNTLALLAPIAIPFTLVLVAVNTMNYKAYKVFRNNDLRSGTPFTTAYGAIARIRHNNWQRYVIFPRDARERAYSVSPAARELRPFFEGVVSQFWVSVSREYPPPWGCSLAPYECKDEIQSAWFVWALRDTVSRAGYYHSADTTDAFYKRLAKEINAACDSGAIPCHPKRKTMTPVWRWHYVIDSLYESGKVFGTLISLGGTKPGIPNSDLSLEQREIFEYVINSRVSGSSLQTSDFTASFKTRDAFRQKLTTELAGLYTCLSPFLFSSALFTYLAMLIMHIWVKSAVIPKGSILLLTALLVVVCSRVGLLGFLEATSLPANNMLYLSPAIPFYLIFIALSPTLFMSTLWASFKAANRTAA